jgi:DNA-binding IclR family transcriptional regulator
MQIISSLEGEFARLHERSVALVRAVPPDQLYWQPEGAGGLLLASCGEHLLRSAASVEQTFGGITATLWDDPFEWTLPETLSTPRLVEEYLDEVEATRRRGFALVKSDAELVREIAVPAGGTKTLAALFVETLARAAHQQGRAFAVFRLFSDARLPSL